MLHPLGIYGHIQGNNIQSPDLFSLVMMMMMFKRYMANEVYLYYFLSDNVTTKRKYRFYSLVLMTLNT